MAYGDLYQRRKPAPPQQAAASPQPQGESMVALFQRTGKLPMDARAGDGFSQAEHARAQEIRFAMSEGRWYAGNSIPHRLMPLVYPDGLPEAFQRGLQAVDASSISASYDTAGSGDVVARLARKIDASLATDHAPARTLATDQQPGRPRNDIAPDHQQYHRPTMSYKLAQVMGDYQLLDEDSFDESMKSWGITEPRDRIGLKAEATALGMMRPRGQAPKLPARYIQAPHVNDPKNQHFIDNNSPSTTKDTGGRPDTPGKRWGLTMQASSDGFAPANTSIWFDDAGLNNV